MSGTTTYEAALANRDSGGGIFVLCGNSWKIMGLGLGILDHSGASWFRTDDAANEPEPDRFVTLRISTYATWINSIVPTPTCVSFVIGDLDNNCQTDDQDLILFSAQLMQLSKVSLHDEQLCEQF